MLYVKIRHDTLSSSVTTLQSSETCFIYQKTGAQLKTRAHATGQLGRRSHLVKVDLTFSLVKTEVQVALLSHLTHVSYCYHWSSVCELSQKMIEYHA
jgi:hypothetical protein